MRGSLADWVDALRARTPQAAVAVVAFMLTAVWLHAGSNAFVPCVQDCGETFIAQHAVTNYRLYGMRHALLQDHATVPAPDRPTFIYTHNPHLGTFLFPLLDQVGLTTLWAKQLLTLAVSGAGLYYVFVAVRRVTKSDWIALSVLALFCTDYAGVFAFALNALRAWHWLALFGLMHHSVGLVSEPEKRPRRDVLALAGFCAIAFGIGYEFLATALVVTALVAILCSRSYRRTLLCIAALTGSTGALFAIRQIQVITAFGMTFWWRDVYYSAAIKFTALAGYLHVPALPEIDAFYLSNGVLRPGATSAPFDQILLGIRQHLERITLPSIGLGAVVGFLLATVVSIAVIVAWVLRPLAVPAFRRMGVRLPAWPLAVRLTAGLFTGMVLGITVGLLALGSMTISIYLKHQMPLIAPAYLIPKGILIALALGVASSRARHIALRSAAAALALLLVADHVAVQVQNRSGLRPMPVAWISEVAGRPDSTFAVSWIPSSVAGFTRNWVIGVQPGAEYRIVERANRGEPPFVAGELMEVNTRDTDTLAKYRLLQPDFWLYFATDEKAEYQSTVPTCNRSYAGRLFDDLFRRQPSPQLARIELVESSGGRVFDGNLNDTGRAIEAVELRNHERVLARARLGCDDTGFAGLLTQADLDEARDAPVAIDAFSYRGKRHALGWLTIASAQKTAALPAVITRRQPSARALIRANQNFRVAAEGPGFVLFDLRGYWNP
jgi:hypothetical protein